MGIFNQMWWGLSVPESVETTTRWGARAIFKPMDQGFDLLGDRQSMRDTEENMERRKFFATYLDTVALGPAREACKSMRSDEPELVTLFEDHVIVVQGNTNGSYGYVYLVAWLKNEAVPAAMEAARLAKLEAELEREAKRKRQEAKRERNRLKRIEDELRMAQDEALNTAVVTCSAFGSFKELVYSIDNHSYVPTLRLNSYPEAPEMNEAIAIVRAALIDHRKPVHPPAR